MLRCVTTGNEAGGSHHSGRAKVCRPSPLDICAQVAGGCPLRPARALERSLLSALAQVGVFAASCLPLVRRAVKAWTSGRRSCSWWSS